MIQEQSSCIDWVTVAKLSMKYQQKCEVVTYDEVILILPDGMLIAIMLDYY